MFTAPAFAASGGSSSSSSSGSGKVPTCKTGEVYDSVKKKCVPKTSEIFPDKDLYEQGRALALAGDYPNALDLLQSVKNQKDPMVLTMIGYAKRKIGDIAGGFDYYHQALAIDPNNLNTHEYMGEAYLVIGKVEEAKLELSTLEKLCGGKGCEQYDDLARVLAGEPNID
jgi:tetratricopeptide (TPR) repeat protein